MHYSPDYPIVQRHLTRIKTRRRSVQPGGPGMGRRSGRSSTKAGADRTSGGRRRTGRTTGAAQRPIQQRTLLLGLAGMIMATAILVILLGPGQVLHAASLAQISNSLVALFAGAQTR